MGQKERFPKRQALSGRIRDAVLGRILRGEVKPGERLVEMRLAEDFETSQAPVREALRELEMSGIVETSRNRGTRVKVTSPEELAEIYDVRAELEGYAAELAIDRLSGRESELEKIMNEMLSFAKTGDVVAFGEANARFHRLIVEASGNSTLLDLWTRLDVRSRTPVNMMRSSADLQATALSHQPIINALALRNRDALSQELKVHIRNFRPV